MRRRLGEAAFLLSCAVLALAAAGVIVLVDGSTNVAWWLAAFAVGFGLFAAGVAIGLERWLSRASPAQQWAYLGGSFAFLLLALGAYLVWQSVALWWLAPLAAYPLFFFLMFGDDQGTRGDRKTRGKRKKRDDRKTHRDGGDFDLSGPLTPPDGGGL